MRAYDCEIHARSSLMWTRRGRRSRLGSKIQLNSGFSCTTSHAGVVLVAKTRASQAFAALTAKAKEVTAAM
jgi:hypothetical protein